MASAESHPRMYNGRHLVSKVCKSSLISDSAYNVAQDKNIHMQEAILSETPWGIIGLDWR